MSSGGSGNYRYGRSPGHENPEEKALRKIRELEAVRRRQYETLNTWLAKQNEAMAKEAVASAKAKECHDAFLAMAKKLRDAREALRSMADSSTEAKYRRNKNQGAVDKYGNMSAEAASRYEQQRNKRRREVQREADHFEESYYSFKSEDQEAEERYEAVRAVVKQNMGYIQKVQDHIEELNEDIKSWEEFLEAQERRRRQQDLHPKWPPGDGPGGPNGWDPGGGGSSGGRQGHGGPFGYGGGRYAADYESRSRGGASHGSQTYGGSGGHRRAAGQTYATPDGKHKQDVADKLATLALDGEQHRPESKPAASKTKPAAATTGPTTRIRANPPGQAGGGQRPSRR